MSYQLLQVRAVHGRITEAGAGPVPVRVKAAAADPQQRAGLALVGQGVRSDLPGHRHRVVQRGIKLVGQDVQPGVGGTRIGRAQRVELLDRSVGLHHHQRAGQQAQPFHRPRLAQDQLDELGEQADPGLLPWRAIPALEDGDQPVRVSGARRRAAPVRVRQQQVKGRRLEFQQRLIGGYRVVGQVNRAQQAAVAAAELFVLQEAQAVSYRAEAADAVGVAAVPGSGFGIAVQADAYADALAGQRFQHGARQQGAVGLHRHVHLGRDLAAELLDQAGQPVRARQQRLTAVQDDIHAAQIVRGRVLGDAVNGRGGYRRGHALRLLFPGNLGHFVHVAVRARQVAAAVHLEDELLKRDPAVALLAHRRDVEVLDRPGGRMCSDADRRYVGLGHPNQTASSSGSTLLS